MHRHLPNLWADATPSAAGIALVAGLAAVGIALVFFLLRSREGDDERPRDAVDGVLDGIARARALLLAELERAEGPLKAALASMIGPPLRELERRVAALVATARERKVATPDLESDRERVRAAAATESDPRAKSLLEASLKDLERSVATHATLDRSRRLALLELERMRTLIEGLPLRVHEVAVRHVFDRGDVSSVEAIAQELELAVQSTGNVMDEVARR